MALRIFQFLIGLEFDKFKANMKENFGNVKPITVGNTKDIASFVSRTVPAKFTYQLSELETVLFFWWDNK